MFINSPVVTKRKVTGDKRLRGDRSNRQRRKFVRHKMSILFSRLARREPCHVFLWRKRMLTCHAPIQFLKVVEEMHDLAVGARGCSQIWLGRTVDVTLANPEWIEKPYDAVVRYGMEVKARSWQIVCRWWVGSEERVQQNQSYQIK